MKYFLLFIIFFICFAGPILMAQSLTIPELEERAVQLSPELASTYTELYGMRANYQFAVRDFFPKISLTGGDGLSVIKNGADSRSLSLGANASLLLFDGGRALVNYQLQGDQLTMQEISYTHQRQALILNLHRGLNKYFMLKEKLKTQEEAYILSEAQFKIMQVKLQQGSVLELDALKAEEGLIKNTSEINASKLELSASLFALVQMLDVPETALDALVYNFDTSYTGLDFSGQEQILIEYALLNNLELLAKRAKLRKLQTSLRYTDTWYLPNITAQGGVSFSGSHFPLQNPSYTFSLNFSFPSTLFPTTTGVNASLTPDRQYGVTDQVSVGILDDLKNVNSYQLAKLRTVQAQKNYGQLQSNLQFKLVQALKQYSLNCADLAQTRRLLVLQERRMAILKKQVELGEALNLDYLNSLNEFTQSKISLLDKINSLKNQEEDIKELLGLKENTKLEGFSTVYKPLQK